MRFLAAKEEEDMNGEQLSEVIMSKNAKFPVGTLVLSNAGWKSHYLSRGDNLRPIRFELGSTPKSYTLGVLGMPGATAYLAFEKCMPKAGETILISAAAGAVGTVVGQLAKIKGLKVVGLVGSDDKLKFCKEELGFDHVFNYKSVKFDEAIKQVAPEGIDIYFDNVGGDYYHTIINNHMKKRGRILVCGSIQTYNDIDAKLCKLFYPNNSVDQLNE
jgi:NADPH-dependent curcumin reductase CurA